MTTNSDAGRWTRIGSGGRWSLITALAAGCCATKPGSEEPEVVTRPVPVAPSFAAIDGEEARRRLWPDPAPQAYGEAEAAEAEALAELLRRMLADPPPAWASELAGPARAAG